MQLLSLLTNPYLVKVEKMILRIIKVKLLYRLGFITQPQNTAMRETINRFVFKEISFKEKSDSKNKKQMKIEKKKERKRKFVIAYY